MQVTYSLFIRWQNCVRMNYHFMNFGAARLKCGQHQAAGIAALAGDAGHIHWAILTILGSVFWAAN